MNQIIYLTIRSRLTTSSPMNFGNLDFLGVLLISFGIGLFFEMKKTEYYSKYLGIYENGIVQAGNIYKWSDLHSLRIKNNTYQIWTIDEVSFNYPINDDKTDLNEIIRYTAASIGVSYR